VSRRRAPRLAALLAALALVRAAAPAASPAAGDPPPAPAPPAAAPTSPAAAPAERDGGGAAAPETADDPGDAAGELVRRGNAARQAGRPREALELYRRARLLLPGRFEIRVLIADTLRRLGENAAALAEYEQAIAIDPGRPEGHAGRAILLRQAWDHETAALSLEAALARVAPDGRPDLLLSLAETRRRQGRLAEAAARFADYAAARPAEPQGHAGLARTAEDRGDLDDAIRNWERVLELDPDDGAAALRRDELRALRASIAALRATAAAERDPAAQIELGRLLAVAGDAAGAARVFRRALAAAPGDPGALRGLALALRDAGDAAGAREAFGAVLRADPGDAAALYNLVALARAAGDPEDERRAWRALLRARPRDLAAARAFLARLHAWSGPDARAAIAAEAAGLPPGAADRERLRALFLAAAERWDGAAAALYRALRDDPTDPWTLETATEILAERPTLLPALGAMATAEAGRTRTAAGGAVAPLHVLQARLIAWSGRPGEALVALRGVVAAAPGLAVARSALAAAYREAGADPELGLDELRHAVRLDPRRMHDHVDLGMGLLKAGLSRQAESAAREGLAACPGAPPLLAILGAALSDLGDREAAADAYADALRGDPLDYLGLARGQYPLMLASLGRHAEARRALRGDLPPIPEIVFQEAWAFARDAFRDRSLNGQDWDAWRRRARGGIADAAAAHRMVAALLASLGDPYTRLRDPEETAAVWLARRGEGLALDRFGRAQPHSRTLVVEERPGGLGYIRLANLTDPAVVEELRRVLRELGEREGIILDLRGNPGGSARAADRIGDLLAGPGREAGVDVGPDGETTRITGGEGAATGAPITVLVDGRTASAAERLARDLVATGRGRLRGEATHGKGETQMTRVLPGGATVLVTVGEMLGPDRVPVEGRGLSPDPPR
jgi:C-terminal processing protease CtpA/Prc/predicted Zn-dependent protease